MILSGLGTALGKDFRLLWRDRVGLVFLTVAPIVVITVAGFSLASLYGADPRGATAYLVPLVDEDGGAVGNAIRDRLRGESAVTLRPAATRAEAEALIAGREAGTALVIPAGTTRAIEEGKAATLALLTDPVRYLEVANVRAIVQEIRHGLETEANRRAKARLAGITELPPAALPGSLEIEETSVTGAPRRLNTFDQNVPGFSVTFLLLGMLFGVSLGLLDERDWGTLERVRAMPKPFASFMMAKLLSRLTVGMVQMVLLFAVGWVAFGVSLGPEPWALALPTAGIVFVATAFGLVVAGLATSREAVLPLGSIVIVTMAAVGGCWWPIDLEPRWMRSVALAFPTTWAMAAYNDLMIRRQQFTAALWPTGVLAAHGAVYLVIGLWLFRRRAV